MEVITKVRSVTKGDYTYNLMSNNMVHINNHKTNDKSIIVPVSAITELMEGK